MPISNLNSLNNQKKQFAVSEETNKKVARNATSFTNSQNNKWYKGDQPTWREAMGRAYQIAETDYGKGINLVNNLRQLRSNPTSMFYNAYSQPTSYAAKNLAALGFDTNQLNDNFFGSQEYNTFMAENLERSATTGSVKSPTKKSSVNNQIAYYLDKAYDDYQRTKTAKDEYGSLLNTAAYLANDPGNYSDEEILDKIHGEIEKKYSTLNKIKNSGTDTLGLTEAIDFSDDVILGAIWMARNPDEKVDSLEQAMAYSYLGMGKTWQANDEISSKLRPLNDDNTVNPDYMPYEVESTALLDTKLFFGRYGFDNQWVEENKNLKYYGTEEEKKQFAIAEQSVSNYNSAEKASGALTGYVNYLIGSGADSMADIQGDIDTALAIGKLYIGTDRKGNTKYYTKQSAKGDREEVDLSILNKIDASVGKQGSDPTGELVPMGQPFGYKYDTFMAGVNDIVTANNQRQNDSETTNTMADDINEGRPHSTNPPSQPKLEGYTTVNAPATEQKETIPKLTEAEIEQEKAGNKKIREASDTVADVATDSESTVMKNAGSVAFDVNKTRFDMIRKDAVGNQRFADALVNVSSKNLINDGLDKAHSIAEYSTVEANYATDKAQFDYLHDKYGDLEYLQQEFQPTMTITVEGSDGDTYDVTMELPKDENGYYDWGKGYQITDIYNKNYVFGESESGIPQDVYNQASAIAKEQAPEQYKILSAHTKANGWGAEGKSEVEEYKRLSKTVYDEEEYLAKNKEANEKNNAALRKTIDKMEMQYDAMMKQGLDASGIKEAYSFLTDMLNYHDEPPLPVMNMGKLEYINSIEQNYGLSFTKEEKSEMLHEGIDQLNEQIAKINADKDYMARTGATVPDSYLRNMDYQLADLEAQKKAYEYSAILTDTDPEELDKAIAAGKAFEEKYGNDMQSWQGLYGTDEENPEYYFTLGKKTTAVTNDDHTEYKFITDDDRRVYYYLLGKKVQELGGEQLDEMLKDTSFNGGIYQAKDLVTEILKDADDFVEFMNDEEYGIWTTKRAESQAKEAQENASLGTNLASTAITPFESMVNAGYALDRALTGGRFSRNAPTMLASIYKENTREATRKNIDEYFKDNPTMKYIANLGYEIYCNRGDSMMNSMFFGMFLPGGGGAMLNEFTGAAPMGFSAAMNAAAKAVENGATAEQAWYIFGMNFLAETVTEAVTYSNIREAFGVGEELTKDSLKQFALDWLKKNGIEEMIGEVAADAFEKYADQAVTEKFDNPNYQNEHQKLVDSYYSQGYTKPGEAEAKALEDEMKGYLHTAFVSYLSAGTDVAIKAGKSALNTMKTGASIVNGYRSYTRQRQQMGFSESMFDYMKQDTKNAIAQKNTQEASEQEAGTAVPSETEEATPEQKQAAADVTALGRVDGGTQTTQTEMIASVLDDGEGDVTASDQANAAAAFMPTVLGDDSTFVMQQVITGASRTDIAQTMVKAALRNAALGNGAATAVVQSEQFKNATPEEKAQMLADTVEQDQSNPDVQQSVAAKVNDYRNGMVINDLASQGHFDQAQQAQAKADKAAAETAKAESQLQEKQDALDAATADVEQKAQAVAEDPSDDNTKQHADAVTRADNADESKKQYEEHLAKQHEAQKEADAAAKKATEDAMASAREIAGQTVAQQDQQRQVEAEAIAEQQRQQDEAAIQAKAEEDQRTGKTQEDEDNAKIDALVDSSSLNDEEKEALKKQLKDRNAKRRQGKINLNGKLTDAESMLALGAFQRKLGVPILFSDEIGAADGLYNPTEGVIYLNARKAQDGSMRLGRALLEVAMHEITHSLEQTKHYQQYRQIVLNTLFGEGKNFDQAAYDLEIKQKQDLYKKNGEELTPEQAEKEIIADFAKKRLSEKDIVQRFMDAGMGGKMRNMLHNINQALKNFFGNMSGEDREVAENLRKAERAFQKAMNERAKTQVHPGAEQFSISQFAQATGMTYNEKTQTLYNANNEPIDGVTEGRKVTPEMIRQTPVGKLIDMGLEADQKQAALDMFSGLMNMIAMLKDNNLVWEIAGGTLESTFSALKANSDTQYHDTIDFGTICAKTQAIVNVMSEVMLDRLKANEIARKEGRYDDVSYGLTRDDVLKIYDETYKAGLSVPCPVCYVFSHWMGVPSLLGQMSRFQHDYIVTGKDASGNDIHYGDGDIVLDENGYATFDPVETEKAARAYIEKMHGLYGDKEGVDARKTKINSEINKGEKRHTKLESDIEKLNNQLKNENLNKRSREAAEKKLAAAKAELEQNAINISALDEELREVEAYNWITQSLMTTNENGEYVIDPDFKITPDEVLLDMRRTGEFADRYDKNWAYRTSRGAGMGKSILPYSGASLGDIIMGNQTRVALTDNPLFNDNEENAGTAKAIESARNRARRQNLIGGQRLQSTSDFRPEWGLDYIMAFLELQAAKSNAQMYTKVAEAVDLFASAGADVNLSIMGSGNGFHEASAEEIAKMTDKQREAATIDGKVYVMDFSDVTGMGYGDALNKSRQYDNVQMILVGMNDTHIRLALAGDEIDFVIPWHSSGNSKDVLSQLVASVEETLNTSSDYTNTQSDKFVSRKEKYIDEETGKKKTRTVDARTDEQKTMWNARIKILTGIAQKAVNTEDSSKGGLTEAEKKYVMGKDANPYLKDLYERFYLKEGDKCYGVALTSAQAKQIFPYEYWQTDVTKPGGTKDTADENGRRFIEYCQAMGVVPRFSGVWDAKNKTVKNGNFAGAVYDSTGKITGYDSSKMQKGYWKLLIDRKMYGLDGNYREQKQIDVSGIKIGELEGEGREAHLTKYNAETGEGSMLPTETSAKYGIPALERRAAEASERLIRKPFDLTGAQKLYSSDFSEAEMDDMLRMAGVDYQDAVARGDMKAAQEDVDFYAEQNGFDTQEKAYHGTDSFGFTEFDMEQSQDMIFVAYSKDMAGTYVSYEDPSVKKVNEAVKLNKPVKEMSGQELFEAAKRYLKTIEGSEVLSIDYDPKSDMYTVTTDESNYFDPNATVTQEFIEYDIKHYLQSNIDELSAGIYQFYTRPGNQLVIDADTTSWDDIPVSFSDETMSTREIAEWARNNGYDSVRINGIWDYGGNGPDLAGYGDIGIFFNQKDVKSADPVTYDDNGNVIPLDQRFNDQNSDIRYSFGDQSNMTDSELDDLLRRAGVQMTQEDIDAYQEKTSRPLEGKSARWSQEEGPAQRQFGGEGGMLEASDEIAQQAINYAMAHNAYYPDTNADQILRAVNWIRKNGSTKNEDGSYTQTTDGFNESLAKVTGKSFDYRSADGQARMIATMAMAVAKNDIRAQVELADAFNRQGTDLGRALQSRKLFRMMTPAGRIASIQKLMQNYQDELDSKGFKTELSFSDWIYHAASVAENEADFRKVQEAAAAELAEQLPISWQERLRSLRMMSMLANPRTHIRNVVGNALFIPAVGLKNKIGALMELGMEKGKRTKTLRLAVDKDIREFARQDAETNRADLTGDSKYDDRTLVEQSKKTLGAFEFLSDLNSNALEKEDWIFLKGHYRRALGGWMQANGYTVEQMKNSPELLEQGRAYALNEAQKATYRDFNALASWLNNPQVAGHELKGTKFVLNAVLPFKKTPANILRRGIEYSPVGLARGLWNLARGMNNGTMTANQVIDKISSGLSGTAVMMLGYLLAGTGAVTCGLDDDDWLEEVKGNQKYSININKLLNSLGIPKLFDKDVTYTVDWAAPMAMPLFVGAAIRNQTDAEGLDIAKVMSSVSSLTEPVFNLTMLDGVNSLLKVNSYSSDSPMTQIGAKVLSNYLSSYVPSALGALARSIDDTQRKAYVEKKDKAFLNGTFNYALEQAENKIPGISQTNIPVRDVWGNAKTSDVAERIVENWISPGYIEKYEENDSVINELSRLYESTQNKGLEPKHADTSFKNDGKQYDLNAQQYDTFDRVHGETQYSMLKELVNNEQYQQMTNDDAKAEIVKKIYSYANDVGKNAVDPDIRYEKKTVDDLVHDGLVSEQKTKMVEAFEKNDTDAYEDLVNVLLDEGVKESEIKKPFGDMYRDQYKEAYIKYEQTGEEKYNDEMDRIVDILDQTGFEFDIDGWEDQADKKYGL